MHETLTWIGVEDESSVVLPGRTRRIQMLDKHFHVDFGFNQLVRALCSNTLNEEASYERNTIEGCFFLVKNRRKKNDRN